MPDAEACIEAGLRHQKSGALGEALGAFEEAATLAIEPRLLARALVRQAIVHHLRSDFDTALATARRAAEAAGAANLADEYAEALNAEAVVHQARGDFLAAKRVLEQVLAATSDLRVRGIALQNLGAIAAQQGAWEIARRRFMQSQKSFRKAGYLWGEAFALNNYGAAAVTHGNHALAADLLERAVGAARRVEDRDLVAVATMNYGEALAGLLRLDDAERLIEEADAHFAAAGNAWRRVECLRILGDIGVRRGASAAAATRFADALALADRIGAAAEAALLRERIGALGENSGDRA
jgi:tetratricopeptide (TPR) repeat protein